MLPLIRFLNFMRKNLLLLGVVAMLMGADGGCGDPEPTPVLPPVSTACTPETCAGCCQNGQCVTSNSAGACGSNGVLCAQCTGNTTCSPDAQACAADLTAYITVQPTQASIVPEDPRDNLGWDADGSTPDVVVELRCPIPGSDQPLITRTPEVSSLTPEWTSGGCTTLADTLVNQPLQIKFIDVDALVDDEINSGAYTIKKEDLERGSVELMIPGYVNSFTLRLTRYQ